MEEQHTSSNNTAESSTISYEVVPSIPIPDNDPSGVISIITVPDEGYANRIIVRVDIKHTYIGDLVVVLVHPGGSEVVLQNREGGFTDDLHQEYNSSTFTGLSPLLGQSVKGDWALRVTDLSRIDVGSLESWSIIIDVTKERLKEVPEPEPHPVDVPIHPDDPALIDELTRQPFADVIAESMRLVWKEQQKEQREKRSKDMRHSDESSGNAFMVHIHGPWGAGKTSVLNFLRENLCTADTSKQGQDLDITKWVVIEFNAWRHQRVRPPWWSLIKAVYRQSVNQLWREKPFRAISIMLREKLWHFRTGSAPYILTFAFLLWLVSIATGLIGTDSDPTKISKSTQDIKNSLELAAGIFGLWGLLLGIVRTFLHGSAGTAKMIMELSRDPLRPLVRHFRGMIKSIVRPVAIFIDDLDRCEADFVIELLRGVQTLFHESYVTYVVAADREWLRACYEASYPDFKEINEPGRSLGYLFLDKLFQISAPLPRLAPDSQLGFLKYLVGVDESKKVNKQEKNRLTKKAERDLSGTYDQTKLLEKIREVKDNPNLQLAYRAVAARRSVSTEAKKRHAQHVMQNYSHLLESNPRAMKRLVNAFAIQNAINILSERDIPIDPLIRWTIIGMRWPELARFLESYPKMIAKVGQEALPDQMDEKNRQLFQSEAVNDVVNGKNIPRAKPLDDEILRQILGCEAIAG